MQCGKHPLTAICTSTLELGIDIGKVKSIAQIGCINSVVAFRQRSGRRNESSVVRIYSFERIKTFDRLHLNLVQNISAVELMLQGKFENVTNKSLHFSTLIQQTIALLASFGSFYSKEAYALLCKEGAFTNVSLRLYLKLLEQLELQNIIVRCGNGHHFQDRSATNPSLPLRPCSVAERAERKRGT